MARVLVIEDEPDLRELLHAALTAAGHQVALAPNGQAGLRLHEEQPVQLVITDIFMPEKDGLEVIRHFRRHAPALPIIAMSGRPELANVMEMAARLGAHRLLTKPFESQELLNAVADLLRPEP